MSPSLDVATIQEHLDSIRESLPVLERFRALSFSEFEEDAVTYWAAERGLERCIQNVLDIGAHILASLGASIPDEYREIIVSMGKLGVIPKEFAARITPMAGFRNILIHEYLAIDLAEVYSILQDNLDDFREFASHIVDFISRNS